MSIVTKKLFYVFAGLILSFSFVASANEKIPDDIRYSLEDMYGANKNEWPSPIYKTDLNKDGFDDWVAIKKGCRLKKTEVSVNLLNFHDLLLRYGTLSA